MVLGLECEKADEMGALLRLEAEQNLATTSVRGSRYDN